MSKRLLQNVSFEAWTLQKLAAAGCCVDDSLSLPRVAVIGDQSHGKSSLFESLTGLDWPQGEDKTTAFPTLLTKLKGPVELLQARILPTSEPNPKVLPSIADFEEEWTDSKIKSLGKIIHAAGDIILNSSKPGSQIHSQTIRSCS